MASKHLAGLLVALALSGLAVVQGRTQDTHLRDHLLAIPLTVNSGGDTTRPVETPDAFSFEAANAPREHQRMFSFGNRLFNTNWVEAPASVKSFDGLGPLYNRVSCSGCHTKDGRGQPPEAGQGPMDSMLLRISIPGAGPHGGPNPVSNYGDQLSERGINGVQPEGHALVSFTENPGHYADGESYSLRVPRYQITDPGYGPFPNDLLISPRVAPQMIGLGLLEAVPDATLLALADPYDTDGDGISGRVNAVWDTARGQIAMGRFGWKAGQPSLLNQNAAAANGDIGLTTGLRPKENCESRQSTCNASVSDGSPELSDEFLAKLTLYTASLAVPAQRNADDAQVVAGAKVFRALGCAGCHMPTLESGSHVLPEIANQVFHPYTDLLLHDMGEGLADHRPEFVASGSEWRTPPLWGLGLVPLVNGHRFLLHDGRARGFAEAILWHNGEAETAREAFRTANKRDRDALVAFLRSL